MLHLRQVRHLHHTRRTRYVRYMRHTHHTRRTRYVRYVCSHIHPQAINGTNPDNGTANVRSDSLLRFMAYAAVAHGAKALNYYCWGKRESWEHCTIVPADSQVDSQVITSRLPLDYHYITTRLPLDYH
jgi:hypothetical protein